MIKIICVGKLKEKYLQELVNDYQKRINKYMKLEIVELKDDVIHSREILNLSKAIKRSDYNVALDLSGKKYTSEEFAKFVDKTLVINSNITFIIGSTNGLSESIFQMCDTVVSFSDLTFPHGLFRAILLEQIYRAFKIINNETYHK